MKFIKVFFILFVSIALVVSIAAATLNEEDDESLNVEVDQEAEPDSSEFPLSESQEPSSLRGISRFLLQKNKNKRHRLTCNKVPTICRAKGSPGPHCCKKKCVNVLTDRHNCGMCGKKCKYNAICCHGKCVNPSLNKRHCGGCNNRCNKGSLCVYGLCNYA